MVYHHSAGGAWALLIGPLAGESFGVLCGPSYFSTCGSCVCTFVEKCMQRLPKQVSVCVLSGVGEILFIIISKSLIDLTWIFKSIIQNNELIYFFFIVKMGFLGLKIVRSTLPLIFCRENWISLDFPVRIF